MTEKEAKFLERVMDYCGEDLEVHPEYSGRGMMGRKTYAVSFSSYSLLFPCVLAFIKENLSELTEEDIPDFGSLRQDNLGRDVIIY